MKVSSRWTAPRGKTAQTSFRASRPYYNGLSSPELAEQHRNEIRVLISTDVLSEGLNLQDASRMINYDIHWNPVRLMQRIGRVDRRMDSRNRGADRSRPSRNRRLARKAVWFWNFLPPEELNRDSLAVRERSRRRRS